MLSISFVHSGSATGNLSPHIPKNRQRSLKKNAKKLVGYTLWTDKLRENPPTSLGFSELAPPLILQGHFQGLTSPCIKFHHCIDQYHILKCSHIISYSLQIPLLLPPYLPSRHSQFDSPAYVCCDEISPTR